MLERLFLTHAERGGMVILTTHQDMTLMQGRLKTSLSRPCCRSSSDVARRNAPDPPRVVDGPAPALRHPQPALVFLIVITLFPLGIGPEPKLLARIAPGIIWVAALLAAMLSLERLFRDDFGDGALEQMMLMPHPLLAGAGQSDRSLVADRPATAAHPRCSPFCCRWT